MRRQDLLAFHTLALTLSPSPPATARVSPMAVQKPGVELRGMGREKLVLVVCRQDSWCRACVTWDTEGAPPAPRRRWYSGCTRSSVCKLTENCAGQREREQHWAMLVW